MRLSFAISAAALAAGVLCIRNRAWLGTAMAPVGLVAGLFLVVGGF